MRKGRIETNTGIQDVYYTFVDEHTIEYTDTDTGVKTCVDCESLI